MSDLLNSHEVYRAQEDGIHVSRVELYILTNGTYRLRCLTGPLGDLRLVGEWPFRSDQSACVWSDGWFAQCRVRGFKDEMPVLEMLAHQVDDA